MNDPQAKKDIALEQGRLFRSYIWGEKGLIGILKTLDRSDYGEDLKLVLFQFYVNPLNIETAKIPEIEEYRKREKSIGIPMIINNENFFSKDETYRQTYIRSEMLKKIDLLEAVVQKKKLDTNINKLRDDLKRVLDSKIKPN